MKTEDMNAIWEVYNHKLERNLVMNEQLLRKINLQSMKKELSKPILSEIVTIVLTAFLVVYLVTLSILLAGEMRFSIPGFIAAGSALGLIIIAIIRVRNFNRLNTYTYSVLEIQKDLYKVQQKRNKTGKFELLLGLCTVTLMWPLVLFTGFQVDVYITHSWWLIAIISAAIFAVPFTLVHEKYYQQKLRNATELLNEIEALENDDY